MDNPIDFIMAAFDRVEESNKQSIAQQQETRALFKEATEQLRRAENNLGSASSRIETATDKLPQSIDVKETTTHVKKFEVGWRTQVWFWICAMSIVGTFLITNLWFKPTVDTKLIEELRETREHLNYHIIHNHTTEAGWKREQKKKGK